MDFAHHSQGILIPNTKGIRSLQSSDVRWVLVVEKEVKPNIILLELVLMPFRRHSAHYRQTNTGELLQLGKALS